MAAVKAHLETSTASINDVDEDGFTALHYAARYNRVDVMRALVSAGAGNVTMETSACLSKHCVTPLFYTCQSTDYKLASVLLKLRLD